MLTVSILSNIPVFVPSDCVQERKRLEEQQEQEKRDYDLALRLSEESKTGGVEEVQQLKR